MKVDLHFHAGGFWNPAITGAEIEPVIAGAGKRGIDVMALTSCHEFLSSPNCPTRYEHYRRKVEEMEKEGYDVSEYSERGVLMLEKDGKKIYFLDGQEIKGVDGDINIICPGKVLKHEPKKTCVEDLAKEGRDLGALVSLAHPFGKDGLAVTNSGLKIAQMLIKGYFDFVEVWDALGSRRDNALADELYAYIADIHEGDFEQGIIPRAIAVSDAHLDRDLGVANTEFNIPANIVPEELFEKLRNAEAYRLNEGSIGITSKARYAFSLASAIAKNKISSLLGKAR